MHGQAFSLFEAMSAVEVGNSKMDAAMAKGPTVEELIASGGAPASIPLPQMLGVMDRLAVMEASWHSGGSLAQTTFSCLYLLQLDRWVGHGWMSHGLPSRPLASMYAVFIDVPCIKF